MTMRRLAAATAAWLVLMASSAGATPMSGVDVAGPEQFMSAALNVTPGALTPSTPACSGATQTTNVSLGWTDTQSAALSASGSSLVSGYTIGRSTSAGGPFPAVTTVTGSPAPTSAIDTPVLPTTSSALVVDGTAAGTKTAYPLGESALSVGAALTVGTTGNQPNAVQITPDGTTAVLAEYASGQVQVLSWNGLVWTLAKTLTVTSPTAVAIVPVADGSGHYVAYVASDPGPTVAGQVYPLTLNGASSSLGAAITIGKQATLTAVVATPDGSGVYVTNYGSNTVSAIKVTTSAVTTIALLGPAPLPIALAVTADSTHVYVADRANSYLDDIATSSNTAVTKVALTAGALNDTTLAGAGAPNIMAMTPDGKTIYVAEYGAAAVQVVNTALAAPPDIVSATLATGTGSQPDGLAMSPNGCLVYVADWATDKIYSITIRTNTIATALTAACQTQDPQPLAVIADSRYAYVPENYSCSDTQIIATGTGVITTLAAIGTKPQMLAIQPNPYWYTVTATHQLWTSPASGAALWPVGFNAGGAQ